MKARDFLGIGLEREHYSRKGRVECLRGLTLEGLFKDS
jgi:hypothetical protein